MSIEKIPFNRPYMTGKEFYYIEQAKLANVLAGDGPFTKKCHRLLEEMTGSVKALLTHSCTAALEMAALLLDIQPGDEVIMPSYTFVSTANAFVLRGAVPVFVDIRTDTLNLDERLVEEAITPRTKAILPVHYAGVACEMDTLMEIARRHGLKVVEDAAQGVMASYKGRALGSIGDLGAFSFHETKNVISGEGGALLVNDGSLALRAEIIREKGTDRSRFFRGEIDKYTWQEVGSSFLPGELTAAFLWAQLEEAKSITSRRLTSWQHYHILLESLEQKGILRRPLIPAECEHNAHMYYVLLNPELDRNRVLSDLKKNSVDAVFHYVPLHSSPGGKRYGRTHGELSVTNHQSERLIRLPLWVGLTEQQQSRIVDVLLNAVTQPTKTYTHP
ncbi:dTDP-4-amino-4,6-dideoxygalactose transaminase [Pseudomonas sp. PCH199]|uniref:dTDP-4-amino-4,6-dideoxygalactose transaminase n=1 Tax=unclassified Pseudomonas TaxID=196821 RepID=UPI000BC80D41|nr:MULTISPECIES: dTDP-4-amino-4,6-dideoxygalactose transaminase [unclassified Pseudomonas]MCW8276150.1 dTDP-4-amino-4,6-dideoxygalactose transaminase [Pseudomonas sp. PCH199]PAM83539.1 dTDP-4-amino-4,6-dideoxygalactose transaminase [Pseudomonas sp. ERMR1:02]